jgi:isocitrate dehydrogenase
MLVYIGQPKVAEKVHNAWLKTLEDGVHTYDLFKEETSTEKVGTQEFADAVIARLGQVPEKMEAVAYDADAKPIEVKVTPVPATKKEYVGVDVFLEHEDRDPNKLGDALGQNVTENLKLTMISNRGMKVYPNGHPETFCTDHWRCRFTSEDLKGVDVKEIIELLTKVDGAGFDIIKTENLCTFDGKPAFSAGQGQ